MIGLLIFSPCSIITLQDLYLSYNGKYSFRIFSVPTAIATRGKNFMNSIFAELTWPSKCPNELTIAYIKEYKRMLLLVYHIKKQFEIHIKHQNTYFINEPVM